MNPKLMAAYLETVRDSDKKKLHDGSSISSQIVHLLIDDLQFPNRESCWHTCSEEFGG